MAAKQKRATDRWHAVSERLQNLRAKIESAEREEKSARIAAFAEIGRHEAIAISRRERQVLELARTGLQNKEIGEKLFISVRTVKFHISALLIKFGVERRTQL